ncbi:MAG: biotin--[acetyl-CoA-carboxylase] ligase [Chloroflexi bacterium]|nr:MAG: biotin--[acetyl-CoA-carboxylase] ligase [Chloroflexota bacterium]
MDRATALAAEAAPAGTVVVSNFQTAGRGTRGRRWLAPPGSCLMFTIISRPVVQPEQLATLPYRVGKSVATVLRRDLGVDCTVKAPNDVLINGRKVCGILCTSRVSGERVDWVLCGIGLNTEMTAEQLPTDAATSLRVEGVAFPVHRELLQLLLAELEWLLTSEA